MYIRIKNMRHIVVALVTYIFLSTNAFAQNTNTYGKNKNMAWPESYAGSTYDVYKVANKGMGIHLFWKDENGHIMKSLGNLRAYTARRKQKLLFAANAGMYTTENGPKGLYIENGKTLRKIDLKKGPATNFYMQPNGVFYTTPAGAFILTSQDFTKVKDKVIYATQSGPMLVVNGQVNKTFAAGSKNINIRSGVGVDKNGNVYFVISEGMVNFYDFAMLFREKLQCSNALFLDGAICRAYIPDMNRTDTGGDFGVMIGVTE